LYVPTTIFARITPVDKIPQLDITDDGFLSLMSDDGSTKDDVKVPDGEVGDKINKMFTEDGKDCSKSCSHWPLVKTLCLH